MNRRAALQAVFGLFFGTRPAALLLGAGLAAATVLAGIGLLGLSGWFVTASALAGLSAATALSFDVFTPAAAIRLLALLRTGARYGERLTTHAAALTILAALRESLFRGWAAPEACRRLLARPAALLFRLTSDIDALDSLYLRILVPAATALLAALAVGIGLSLASPPLGLGLAGFLLLTGFGIPMAAARAGLRPARRRAHALEALRARTIDLVSGQADLCLAGRLPAQAAAVSAADARLAAADDALNRIEVAVGFGFSLASAAALAGTLVAAALLVREGIFGAPMAALAVFIAVAAIEPFGGLKRGAVELGRTLLSARRLAPRLREAAPWPRLATPPAGLAAALDGVAVQPEGAALPLLHDITLTIRPGERLAVIGPSGAGKSSLLALLAGETFPTRGSVACLPTTRLTQRTELFQDSLRENLRLADPAADDARLGAALAAAGLADVLAGLPQGLDTRLGEGGLGLSAGQGRRLALARLFLRDTPVWLLDEPTEGLDGPTARDVLARLAERAEGRTLVIATHIRREAALADRLVSLDGGRIVAEARRGEAGFAAALARLRPD